MSEQLRFPYIIYERGEEVALVVFSCATSVKVFDLFSTIDMVADEKAGADNTVRYAIDDQERLVSMSFQLLDVAIGAPTANLAGLGV